MLQVLGRLSLKYHKLQACVGYREGLGMDWVTQCDPVPKKKKKISKRGVGISQCGGELASFA